MRSHDFYNTVMSLFMPVAGPDRLLVCMGALLVIEIIGFITGPIAGNANPWLWTLLDKLFGFGRKTYKIEKSSSTLSFRGALFGVLYIVTATMMGSGFWYVLTHYHYDLPLEILMLVPVLTGGAVWVALKKLHQALKEGSKLEKGSYRPIAISTRYNLNSTDDYGITRVGVGYMPKAFDKGLIAPVFWYLIGGLPLAYFYAGVACAAWALSKEGYAKNFGALLLTLEKIFGLLPNVISGIFLMMAAIFTPSAQVSRIFPMFFKREDRAKYAEGGFPLTATAYALNVSLGGPVEDIDGSVIRHGWIGPKTASARLDKGHLKRAIYMSVMAYILVFSALVAGLLAWKEFNFL